MSEAGSEEQKRVGSEQDMRGIPAHMEAAAEAAGEQSAASGAQDIGAAALSSGAQAVHGRGQEAARPAHSLPIRWAFDEHNPPSPELIDDCVHCGFCLPTCPTYLLWAEEMDSPRGRIHLMQAGNEGRVEMTDTFVRHFDQCLGCMACVTACPSGVQYDKLIESTRQQVERHHPRTLADRLFRRMIYSLFPYPNRLRVAVAPLWLYQASGLRGLV